MRKSSFSSSGGQKLALLRCLKQSLEESQARHSYCQALKKEDEVSAVAGECDGSPQPVEALSSQSESDADRYKCPELKDEEKQVYKEICEFTHKLKDELRDALLRNEALRLQQQAADGTIDGAHSTVTGTVDTFDTIAATDSLSTDHSDATDTGAVFLTADASEELMQMFEDKISGLTLKNAQLRQAFAAKQSECTELTKEVQLIAMFEEQSAAESKAMDLKKAECIELQKLVEHLKTSLADAKSQLQLQMSMPPLPLLRSRGSICLSPTETDTERDSIPEDKDVDIDSSLGLDLGFDDLALTSDIDMVPLSSSEIAEVVVYSGKRRRSGSLATLSDGMSDLDPSPRRKGVLKSAGVGGLVTIGSGFPTARQLSASFESIYQSLYGPLRVALVELFDSVGDENTSIEDDSTSIGSGALSVLESNDRSCRLLFECLVECYRQCSELKAEIFHSIATSLCVTTIEKRITAEDMFRFMEDESLLFKRMGDEALDKALTDFCVPYFQRWYRRFILYNERFQGRIEAVHSKCLNELPRVSADTGVDAKLSAQLREYIVRCMNECWAMIIHKPNLTLFSDRFQMVRGSGKQYSYKKTKFTRAAGSDVSAKTVLYCVWPTLRVKKLQHGKPVVITRDS